MRCLLLLALVAAAAAGTAAAAPPCAAGLDSAELQLLTARISAKPDAFFELSSAGDVTAVKRAAVAALGASDAAVACLVQHYAAAAAPAVAATEAKISKDTANRVMAFFSTRSNEGKWISALRSRVGRKAASYASSKKITPALIGTLPMNPDSVLEWLTNAMTVVLPAFLDWAAPVMALVMSIIGGFGAGGFGR